LPGELTLTYSTHPMNKNHLCHVTYIARAAFIRQ
jgi:hypothetical protein